MNKLSSIYEAWGIVEWDFPNACIISTVEGCQDLKDKGLMTDMDEPPNDLVPLFSIRANSWTEAMTIYNEIQGWSPYIPMKD